MKNLLNYYYNILIKKIRKIDNYYILSDDSYEYLLLPYDGDVNFLYKIYTILKSNNKACHDILMNKDRSVITFYENIQYILLRKSNFMLSNIDILTIIKYDDIVLEKEYTKWKDLWKNKIDYYEYQISQFGIKYPLIRNSFGYYVGLSELSISLLNYVDYSKVNCNICHKRINLDSTSFINPLNIILDNYTRDIAEYYKLVFMNDKIDSYEIIKQIDSLYLNHNDAILLLSRLIYPSYYFDIYDKIVQGKIDESKIEFYTKKNTSYEEFLKNVYKLLKNKYNIVEIDFLES